MQIFHIKNNRKNYFLLFISKSICQCPFLPCFQCCSSTMIFCPISLVRTIYCIVFVIILYNIGFFFLCFLFRNIISVTYPLALIIPIPFPIHSRSVSDPLSGLSQTLLDTLPYSRWTLCPQNLLLQKWQKWQSSSFYSYPTCSFSD